jgi:hypothetical protein
MAAEAACSIAGQPRDHAQAHRLQARRFEHRSVPYALSLFVEDSALGSAWEERKTREIVEREQRVRSR